MTQSNQTETLKKLYIELKKSRDKLKRVEEAQHEPIAVIGMGCRFPGGADDPEKFWKILAEGRDAVSDVPADRWEAAQYYDADPVAPGKMYTVKAGFLSSPVAGFDAQFFNISPKEARALDPQQRILLEVAWETMENAGMDATRLKGSDTGVFIGMSGDDYAQAHRHGKPEIIDAYSLTGSTFSTAAGRLSYTWGLEGPSMLVDTACSSSLVALHSAMRSLRSGETGMALVGGVNMILTPDVHICFSKLQAISVDGKCKTFDASANGYVRGEGCGLVLLKRLSDAQKDNDRILALIRGTAVNQDGKSSGFTAPNGVAQEKVIEKALKDARLSYGDVDYIEAHGTGTSLGDPIEVEALGKKYGKARTIDDPVLLGSVKTNVGHLESAAGMAGLLKVIQALRHEALPATIHFDTPNPYIPWETYPVKVVERLTPWIQGEKKRRAGLSSFGFSGTNAHVIVEEAPVPGNTGQVKSTATMDYLPREGDGDIVHMLNLSAESEGALKELAQGYVDFLGKTSENISDICYTAEKGRTPFRCRLAAIGKSKDEIKDKLAAHCAGETGEVVTGEVKKERKIACLFTGQGSQYVGMGRGLFQTRRVFREAFEECDGLFKPLLEKSIIELIYAEGAEEAMVNRTDHTQPLIFALQYALAQLWESLGITPAAVVGHSIGEYAAAVITGVMTLEEGVRLVAARGRLMHSAPGEGAMGVIFAGEETVAGFVDPHRETVSIAAVNAEKNITVSGDAAAVKQVLEEAASKGIKTRELIVSHAFHSPLMDPILGEFEGTASEVTFKSPKTPFISTITGKTAETGQLDARYWSRQIRGTVRYYDALKTLQEEGIGIYLEIGSAPILSSLAAQILDETGSLFTASLRKGKCDRETFANAKGALYTSGVPIKRETAEGSTVTLPTYPFQREHYWMKPLIHGGPVAAVETTGRHSLVGQKITSPLVAHMVMYQSAISAEKPYFMQEHIIFDSAISPAAAHVSMLLSAVLDMEKNKVPFRFENIEFIAPLVAEGDREKNLQIAFIGENKSEREFLISSKYFDNPDNIGWDNHCTGSLTGAGENPRPPLDIDALKEKYSKQEDTETLYKTLWDLGYHLGTGFQRIKEVWKSSNEGICRIELPDPGEIPGNESYDIYPGIIDSIFQSAIPVSDYCLEQMTGSRDIFIPISISGLNYYKHPAGTVWCHVKTGHREGYVIGDMTVCGEDGEIFFEIETLTAKQTNRSALLAELVKYDARMYYHPDWVEEEALSPVSFKESGYGSCIIFADSGPEAGARRLEEVLKKEDVSCITVLKGSEYSRTAPGIYTIDPASPDDYQRLFKDIPGETEEPLNSAAILYLWGLDSAAQLGTAGNDAVELTTPQLRQEYKESCGSLVNIAGTLARLQLPVKTTLHVITRQAVAEEPGTSLSDPTQAMLAGLARTAGQELPDIWGVLVDVDRAILENSPHTILEEIAGAKEEQVCLRGNGKRYVARLARTTAAGKKTTPHSKENETLNGNETALKPGGTYLVTGGLGTLGLAAAQQLKQMGARNLVLTGRSAPGDAAREKIAQLRADGTIVETLKADVSVEEDVARLMEEIRRKMPPLLGIVHSAGVLEDAMLTELTIEGIQKVFAPKVDGAWNLHRATQGTLTPGGEAVPLEMFVMFSSATATMGSPGQANYAAANAFLNGLARYRKQRNLPALSIGWGPWAGDGMAAVDDNRGERLSRRGLFSLSMEDGLNILAELISAGPDLSYIMAIDADLRQYSAFVTPKQRVGLLAAFTGESLETGAPEAQGEAALLKEKLQNALPMERHKILLSHVTEVAGKVMGYEKNKPPAADKPLMDQGADSLMAVDIRNRLAAGLDETLPVTLLYEYPTLEKISDYILLEILDYRDREQQESDDDSSTEDLLAEIGNLLDT
ncbi:MAG: type I polyketide synthase [bacterium]|nr:type I polyketide synthase [bacterium]